MKHFLFILTALLAAFITPVRAQDGNQVTLNIYADHKQATIGSTINLLIEQDIAPHWHTYWTNPGDSGEPMTITWHLPSGSKIAPLQSPTPKRIPVGPLVNFGYDGKAGFLTNVTIPTPFTGKTFPIRADVTWLVCEEICIPESAKLSVDIPIGIKNVPDNTGRFVSAQDKLPRSVTWPANATYSGNDIHITILTKGDFDFSNAVFFPDDWGLIDNAAQQDVSIDSSAITLTIPRDKKNVAVGEVFTGILRFGTPAQGINLSITMDAPPPEPIMAKSSISLFSAIIFALLGGMILNLMPCVFPILSMKALHLAQLSEHQNKIKKARTHGLVYTVGVITSFLVVGAILGLLKAGGAEIGWGFQLQDPTVLIFLFYLMVAIGLYFAGLFEFGNRMAGLGSSLANKTGLAGSFFTGVLAVVVAAPCTAPFMASALGYALTQTTPNAMIVFTALGLGMALPFLILSLSPALHKIMPKPGTWMITFRQFLAFPMFLTALWLLWVYMQQNSTASATMVLLGAILIGFALWLGSRLPVQQKILRLIMVLITAIALYFAITLPFAHQKTQQLNWQPYTPQILSKALNTNLQQAVFVNMTADWCITCKVNETIAFNNKAVSDAFIASNTLLIEGDWTNHDSEITRYLTNFERAGVPLYVYYAPGNPRPAPVLLPQILTPQIIMDHLKGNNS